jgi:hypothetical protein
MGDPEGAQLGVPEGELPGGDTRISPQYRPEGEQVVDTV